MSRILIVDDEEGIRTILAVMFRQAGFDVHTAADAEGAIEACRAAPFDAVLADVIMPGMNGHELMRWIASAHPETRTALMTGCDIECPGCPWHPRCTVLSKPFHPAEAVTLIRCLLNGGHN